MEVDEKWLLQMNQGEEKYVYDCRYEEWTRIDKEKLFKRQWDLISKKKLFRIDFSQKIFEDKKVLEKIKNMF